MNVSQFRVSGVRETSAAACRIQVSSGRLTWRLQQKSGYFVNASQDPGLCCAWNTRCCLTRSGSLEDASLGGYNKNPGISWTPHRIRVSNYSSKGGIHKVGPPWMIMIPVLNWLQPWLWTMDYGLWTMDYGLWTMEWDVGCGMWDVGYGMWDVGCGMLLYLLQMYAVITLCCHIPQDWLHSIQLIQPTGRCIHSIERYMVYVIIEPFRQPVTTNDVTTSPTSHPYKKSIVIYTLVACSLQQQFSHKGVSLS
jgi:hypothetical protein